MKLKLIILVFTLFTFSNGFCQTAAQDEAQTVNTLSSQYKQLKDEANNYQIYQVVKESALDNFWGSVADTLHETSVTIASLNAEVAKLKNQVKELKSQVAERDTSLSKQEYNIDHMSFLGMMLTKSTYVVITWIIIFILLIIALILFFRFQNANKVTVRTRKEFAQLQEEFEMQRKKARETESKIKRDLQTELNRVEELKSQLGK